MQGVFKHEPAFFEVLTLGHNLRPFDDVSHIAGINLGVGSGVMTRYIVVVVCAFR